MRLPRRRRGDDDASQEKDNRGGGFNRWWGMSAAVMVIVGLMAIGAVAGRWMSGPADPQDSAGPTSAPSRSAATSRPAPTATASQPSPSVPAAGKCPARKAPSKEQQAPESVADVPRTTWEPFGGGVLSAPRTDAGPAVRTGTVRRCYTHTPLGAVTAAGTLLIASAGKREVARFALTHQWTAGKDRDQSLKRVNAPDGIPPESQMSMQISGYKLLNYGPERAAVGITLLYSNGGLAEFRLPMVWSGDDWKVQGSGQPKPKPQSSQDPSFVTWGTEP